MTVKLVPDDYAQLINILKNMPELQSEDSRRQMLINAQLKQLIPNIVLSGAPWVAVSRIVNYLLDYGRLTYDNETLGLFLNYVKSHMGVENQRIIDTLLIKYDMMTPIKSPPEVASWQGKESMEKVLEKIIGENTLRPIAFLNQGLKVAQSVAYVGVNSGRERWSGTGFLVTSDLLLTNNHVVPSADFLTNALFRFNYEENFKGEVLQTEEYRAKLKGIFHTNETLDYSIIQLENDPGKRWGWLQLLPREIRKNDRLNIIQHPYGQPKQISFQNNFVEYVGDNVIQYVTSTMAGSSGSPCMNDGWEVVALHHAGGHVKEPTSHRRYFRNEGILISSIIRDLPLNLSKLITSTA